MNAGDESKIAVEIRGGYTFHVSPSIAHTGPCTVEVPRARIAGQEHKLVYIPGSLQQQTFKEPEISVKQALESSVEASDQVEDEDETENDEDNVASFKTTRKKIIKSSSVTKR